ncbi:hypothetical protein D6C00_10345 [Thiohalobacter thiocyanaticus]|uniref:Uncharacterized protein n=1 Tax=Thiohalobacter thiocyanaticus TaxID=585455 RepID=A0A426QKP1_9GAMM|nr:hypothetical protein D6C00_10345 [Thiohalobacter thiocyanaticus]
MPVTYRREWQDGFGARGWKLDIAIGDEFVIASTAYTGGNIPTSVLIHDIVDHYLCGFGLSGHRDEAMALIQLRERTGTDIEPDYAQMVDEDVARGLINGEPLEEFLPSDLAQQLPAQGTSTERMRALRERIGEQTLRQRLIARFFELGEQGRQRAQQAWQRLGLDYAKRPAIALALQHLLERADACWMLEQDIAAMHGQFVITPTRCRLEMDGQTWKENLQSGQ